MAILPNLTIVNKIDNITHSSLPRPHLGASQIGNPCQRYLVYTLNWAYKNHIPARNERIFRLGDAVEQIIINALTSIGIVHTDGQLQIRDDYGFFGGSIDGLVHNVPGHEEVMLFEAKSVKNSNYSKFKTSVLELSNPGYYAQVQSYMKHLKLKNTLFCVMNKDTCELYIEIVPFNEDKAALLEVIEEAVIRAESIHEFPKLSNNPAWFECKFCSARHICHSNANIERNCRTCKSREYHVGGTVYCGSKGIPLSVEEQCNGCEDWQLSEMWT